MTKEKFILLSLQEDKAKHLAQTISNKSCRKILNILADKEATATELAKELKLPISTVTYNLKNLIKGGLVICEEFHFSPKGKEVNHYKLASKYIIIAPSTNEGFMQRLKSILPVATLVGAATLAIQFGKKFFLPESMFGQSSSKIGVLSAEMVAPITQEAAMAPIAPEAARLASDSTIGVVRDTAVDMVEKEMFRAAPDVMQEVTMKTAEHITSPDIITLTAQPSPWQNIALWFLIGAVFTLAAYLLFSYLKKK